MLKLMTSISKKVGMPDYGSRGASVGIETELDARVIEDPDSIGDHIRRAFDIAREAVDTELANGRPNQEQPGDGHRGQNGNGDQPVRQATVSQIRAIRAIAGQRQLDPDRMANDRFHVSGVEELTLREASSLIDELKAKQASGRNGGGR